MPPRIARGAVDSSLVILGLATALALLAAFEAPRTPGGRMRAAAHEGELSAAPLTTTTPSATPPLTGTAPMTDTPTPTEEAATPTTAPTMPPKPAFLPLALRERCDPPRGNVDVVFVIDGSSYMQSVRRGMTAWESALAMVRTMVAVMDFSADRQGNQDHAGVVVFRHQAQIREVLPLSRSAGDLTTFIDALEYGEPDDGTRMDIAVRLAADMLDGTADRVNRPVIVFLSEMQAKNVPYKNEPGCGEDSDEHCTMMNRAREAKERGIVFVIFATGIGARGEELLAMASDPVVARVMPSEAEIGAIYGAVLPFAPCTRDQFWP